MKLKKRTKRIIKLMKRLKISYYFLSEKEKNDFWEALDMLKRFINEFEAPAQLTEL